jgi:hypothetical protein
MGATFSGRPSAAGQRYVLSAAVTPPSQFRERLLGRVARVVYRMVPRGGTFPEQNLEFLARVWVRYAPKNVKPLLVGTPLFVSIE